MSDQDPKVSQLPEDELSKVVGGDVSLSFGKIHTIYTQQGSTEDATAAPANPPVKK